MSVAVLEWSESLKTIFVDSKFTPTLIAAVDAFKQHEVAASVFSQP